MQFFRRPEGRLSVVRAFRLLKKLLMRLLPSRFIQNSGCRKWVRMVFRILDTSLHRVQQSSFLIRPEGKLWILRLNRLLKRLRPRRFFDAQDAENELAWPFESWEHRIIDHQSWFLRRPEVKIRVLSAIQLHITTLKRLRPSRFFTC
jgi:hypothetical protein